MRFFGSKVENYKKQVYNFLTALGNKDWEKFQAILSENAVLMWGPYIFNNREQILKWAKELHELFPTLGFQEKSLEVSGTTVKHDFIIVFISSNDQKGLLPCSGIYSFKDSVITEIKISLLPGVLAVEKKDLERIKPST